MNLKNYIRVNFILRSKVEFIKELKLEIYMCIKKKENWFQNLKKFYKFRY